MVLPVGIFIPSAGRTTHQDGDALKNLALKKRSIQSRKLWGVAGASAQPGNGRMDIRIGLQGANCHTTKAN